MFNSSSSDSDKLAESAADLREIGVIPFCIGVNEASVPELHVSNIIIKYHILPYNLEGFEPI